MKIYKTKDLQYGRTSSLHTYDIIHQHFLQEILLETIYSGVSVVDYC